MGHMHSIFWATPGCDQPYAEADRDEAKRRRFRNRCRRRSVNVECDVITLNDLARVIPSPGCQKPTGGGCLRELEGRTFQFDVVKESEWKTGVEECETKLEPPDFIWK